MLIPRCACGTVAQIEYTPDLDKRRVTLSYPNKYTKYESKELYYQWVALGLICCGTLNEHTQVFPSFFLRMKYTLEIISENEILSVKVLHIIGIICYVYDFSLCLLSLLNNGQFSNSSSFFLLKNNIVFWKSQNGHLKKQT